MADWPYNTSRWKRIRLLKLSADPLCFACKLRGRLEPARHVDHIKAISQGGEAFPPLDKLMSLCARCHSEKTGAIDRGKASSGGRRFKGFDASGNPIDPEDGWFSHD